MADITPIEQGHIYMTEFENGKREYIHVVYIMQVLKDNQSSHMNFYGNYTDLLEELTNRLEEIEEYDMRVEELLHGLYPELWI